ncbi:hypothetical protein F5877DRAFT_53932, partial [Lentinula edodes]
IIIRHNVATELSITKGQRGAVYGWHEGVGALNQRVLEVLFVLLDNPPTPIHVPELPPNVVPLTRRKTKGFVTLKNDVKISITRSQVDILPGFSMTAHASQGQGFKTNAADLNSLSDHHAIYTALSRSCTAGTTIILQGFDSRKITGGASGQLRREYRELEILDEITHLRYEGKLDPSVIGNTRNLLIESFLAWKGANYVPSLVHPAIKWSTSDPYVLQENSLTTWSLIDKKNFAKLIKQKRDALLNTKSHAHNIDTQKIKPASHISEEPVAAVTLASHEPELATDDPKKTATAHDKKHQDAPLGMVWSNNSCAFDAVLTILRLIWVESKYNGDDFTLLPKVMEGFQEHQLGLQSLESVRDNLRLLLQRLNPREFTFGAFCSVGALLEELLKLKSHLPFMSSKLKCDLGHLARRHPYDMKHSFLEEEEHRIVLSTSTREWISVNGPAQSHRVCTTCKGQLKKYFHIENVPKLLAFSCEGRTNFAINHLIHMKCNNETIYYKLNRHCFSSNIL